MTPSPSPALSVSVDLARASVRVTGELDRDTAHHLLDAVVMLSTRPARRWDLDVAEVTFCDAGGLRALTSAHGLAADSGRTLRVSRTSRPVERLVGLVGHDRVFPAATPPTRTAGRRSAGRSASSASIRCGTTGTA